MTTANAIEAMTDAGEFEILATRVLRQIDTDYARVEHMGVNADGKTVKNPVDGFTKVPGTEPALYVMASFSTDQVDNVEKKLLFDHTLSTGKKYKASDDGDLVKAGRLAQTIREADANAKFVFTFCTNKQPDDSVMQKGYNAGTQLGIEVRFLARSTIRDHLDTKPAGQWLRQQHLGISADLLSLPLLRDVAKENISAYLHELFCTREAIVETATTKRLFSMASHPIPTTTILTGPSGSGKSVACYQLLSQVMSNGGIGIWVAAETADDSLSLDEAITRTLRGSCPSLGLDAGRIAQALTAHYKVPLIIVVDDVNRTAAPSQCIRKLISWNRRAAAANTPSGKTADSRDVPRLVIPAWNHFWNSIARQYRSSPVVGELSTQPMTTDEAHACLEACAKQPIGKQTSFDLARRLEFDPILLGLWGKLYGNSPSGHLDAEPRTLIADYIRRVVEQCTSDGALLPADIHAALDALSERMLTERELYPPWSLVIQWLEDTQLDALRQLSVSGGICRVISRDEEDRFVFRHDRLLESALAKPLEACLRDIESNLDIVADPYFTDSLARSLVSLGNAAIVPLMMDHAPLAVLGALRHLSDPESEIASKVLDRGSRWLSQAVISESMPAEVVFAAADILRSIKNPLVLTVTKSVKDDHRFSGARLVNGDAVCGKFFVAGRHFYPGSHAPFIEDTVAQAKQLHLSQLCEQLAAELFDSPHSESQLRAALILAGYLGDPSLAEPVLHAWRNDKDNKCLVEALWASLRCSTDPELTLAPILDSWATLPCEKDEHERSERTEFITELTWSMRHGVHDEVVEHLVSRARADERLSNCVTDLLADIDHPNAVAFVACEMAILEREIEGTDKFSFWSYHYRQKWDPIGHNGSRLSNESRSAILRQWALVENDYEKKSLLRTWVATTDSCEELLALSDDVLDSTDVLWRRARLGDETSVDFVLALLEDESRWWDVVPAIWTDRFVDSLNKALGVLGAQTPDDFSGGQTNDHYKLSKVLRGIPCDTAEKLLLDHWESLKSSAQFLQTAFYIGSETLISACEQVLGSAPESWQPLEHMEMTFGFRTTGLQDRLTEKHINAVLRFLGHIPDMALMDLAVWLKVHGREDILNNQVLGEIWRRVEAQRSEGDNSYVVRLQLVHFPTDDDLLDALEGGESDDGVIWRWCHHATKRSDPPERLRSVIEKWVSSDPTPERVAAVAKIVRKIGVRQDACDLSKYQSRFGNETTELRVSGAIFAVRYRTLR